jgi:hypothetical protein
VASKLWLRKAAASIAVVVIFFAISAPSTCLADEGGVSFWYPGTYGSLAAELQEPGWSVSVIDYHTHAYRRQGNLTAKSKSAAFRSAARPRRVRIAARIDICQLSH